MISSVAVEVKNYILSKFPKGFFKHVYIDTAQTVSEQNRNEKYNVNANKIPYPSMTISPEISLDDPIGGMEKGQHLSSPNLYLRRDIETTYRKLVVDPDKKFSIYYTSDYVTTNFNFKLVTNSYIQNADLSFFLKSNFQKDFFQFLNHRGIQSEIPKTFIRAIADIYNWDLNKPEEMDELRLYLIGTSKQEDAIQKRTNLATGKQCFFVNEKQNFLILFTDLDCPPSINRESQAESDYTITFRFQVSVWLPNAYIMSINKNTFAHLQQKTKDEINNPVEDIQEQGIITRSASTYVLKDSTIRFIDNYGNEQIGQLIYKDMFVYSLETQIPLINILNKLPYEVRQAYQYGLYKMNIDMSSLLYFYIYSPSSGQINKENIEFNYNDPDGGIKVTANSDDGIGIGVYLNRLLFESIKAAMVTDKNFFSKNKLALMDINIGGFPVRAIVRSFVNKDEMNSSDPAKSLRVKTGFGIGYISLINEKKSVRNAYKICVGFNEDGSPIIKQFEIEK